MPSPRFHAAILTGGRGTRFWPRSRRATPKQTLALDGERTMLQETVSRLAPLAAREQLWVITRRDLAPLVLEQLPEVDRTRVLGEPLPRNTAPAIGLVAFILSRIEPDAVLGMFPSDHIVTDVARFQQTVARAAQVAGATGTLVLLGVSPTRAETGYGYIELGERAGEELRRVRRFTEKPNAERAAAFWAGGAHLWNAGIVVASASTLAAAMREHFSATAGRLERIAEAFGSPRFASVYADLYPSCEDISLDLAVLQPRSAKGEEASAICCLRADVGWTDVGSFASLYEHRAGAQGGGCNVVEGRGSYALDASGSYVYAPKKFVAMIGVRDLVVVETDDALLITTRDRAQEVSAVVKHLEDEALHDLL
jgi:mannose-1-phosphate guanylyltransferase